MTAQINIAIMTRRTTVGDLAAISRAAPLAGGRSTARRRSRGLPELMLFGYPPEDLVLKPALCADARRRWSSWRRHRRWRAGVLVGGPWREPEAGCTTRPACWMAAAIAGGRSSTSCRLRRLRREAGVRAGPDAGPGRVSATFGSASWSARTCGARTWRRRWGESGAELYRAQRLPVRAATSIDGRIQLAVARVDRDRAAADLRQPGRRPGRAGVRRGVVRARRRPHARRPRCRLRRSG